MAAAVVWKARASRSTNQDAAPIFVTEIPRDIALDLFLRRKGEQASLFLPLLVRSLINQWRESAGIALMTSSDYGEDETHFTAVHLPVGLRDASKRILLNHRMHAAQRTK